jgi:hypothetical protein
MYHLTAAAHAANLAITPQQARTAGVIIAIVAAVIALKGIWNTLFGRN